MRRLLVTVVLLLFGAGACSAEHTVPEAAPTTVATTSTIAAPTTTSTAPPAAGCDAPNGVIPAGSAEKPTIDVDGDGRRDVLWFGPRGEGGGAQFGVRTAAGRIRAQNYNTAAPVNSSALAVRLNRRDPAMILVFNRGAYVFTYQDCSIQPVNRANGEQFWFGLGWTDGTGVACLDLDGDGDREFVELFDFHGSDDATGRIAWKKTGIRIDGTEATVGPTVTGTYQLPTDQSAVDNLHGFTCGTVTEADGVHE